MLRGGRGREAEGERKEKRANVWTALDSRLVANARFCTRYSFNPDKSKVKGSTNSIDVWLTARTQGLIKFVHQEMQAYRLYTVMPELVSFVTELTNWYVRLNRDRLKGTDADSETGLQVRSARNVRGAATRKRHVMLERWGHSQRREAKRRAE